MPISYSSGCTTPEFFVQSENESYLCICYFCSNEANKQKMGWRRSTMSTSPFKRVRHR